MAKNTSISLGAPYLDFIERQIEKGRFATARSRARWLAALRGAGDRAGEAPSGDRRGRRLT